LIVNVWSAAAGRWAAGDPEDTEPMRAWHDALVRCCRRDIPEAANVSDVELRTMVRKRLGPSKASVSSTSTDWTWGIDLDAEIAEIERLAVAGVRDALAARPS
jgi:hypothetical protein